MFLYVFFIIVIRDLHYTMRWFPPIVYPTQHVSSNARHSCGKLANVETCFLSESRVRLAVKSEHYRRRGKKIRK